MWNVRIGCDYNLYVNMMRMEEIYVYDEVERVVDIMSA